MPIALVCSPLLPLLLPLLLSPLPPQPRLLLLLLMLGSGAHVACCAHMWPLRGKSPRGVATVR